MSTDTERWKYYCALKAQGKRIKLESILICPRCESAYHIDLLHGASRNHCGRVDCKLTYERELRERDNKRRLEAYHKSKRTDCTFGLIWGAI